jgi:hypothetical protein
MPAQPQSLEQLIADRVLVALEARIDELFGALAATPGPETENGVPTTYGWDVFLWEVPEDTRIGLPQLCEAFRKEKSWVYARTSGKCDPEIRLPHRRDPGNELVFVVGELRQWYLTHERLVHPGVLARKHLDERKASSDTHPLKKVS